MNTHVYTTSIDAYDACAGDVIGGNFKVPDRMAGAMEEGRAVGASSCGQPFIPARNQGSALPIRVSQFGPL